MKILGPAQTRHCQVESKNFLMFLELWHQRQIQHTCTCFTVQVCWKNLVYNYMFLVRSRFPSEAHETSPEMTHSLMIVLVPLVLAPLHQMRGESRYLTPHCQSCLDHQYVYQCGTHCYQTPQCCDRNVNNKFGKNILSA